MQPILENIHKAQLARVWSGRYTDISMKYIGQAALMSFSAGNRAAASKHTPSIDNERAATNICASEAAEYIADVCREIATLARARKLDSVAYLLDMARMEASRVKGGER